MAADHGHGRRREPAQRGLRGEVVAADVGHRVGRVTAAEQVADVGAGAEAGAGPGDHQHPHRRIGGEAGEHPGQRRPHRRGHGVALGRPVDGEDGDRAAPLDGQVLGARVLGARVLGARVLASGHPS